MAHLRHFEMPVAGNAPGGRWIILCHNCAAAADKVNPPARSLEALKMRLSRDRRWGERRTEGVGPSYRRNPAFERRFGDRRRSERDLPELDGQVIELEAEYEEVSDDQIEASEEVTGIHLRIPLPE
jgi:hypothetical protein